MITPSQIREKKISTVESGGYDRDEVNELLLDIIESYEAIFDENKELYRKMEVLANRIEEYRADEDSIKTALITAQKMASQVTREAKEKADKSLADSAASAQQTVVDAKEKADKIIGEAREYVAGLTKEKAQAADEIVSEAQKKANEAIDSARVVAGNALSQARKLAGEIVNKAKAEKDYHSEIVSKLRDESKDFRATLVGLYEAQLDKLKDMVSEPDTFEKDSESIEELEKELNTLMENIAEVVGDEAEPETAEEPEQDAAAEETVETADEDEIEENGEEEVSEVEEIEEISDDAEEQSGLSEMDEVDEIIDELESSDTYAPLREAEDEPVSEEEVSNAIDAFTADEITPIEEGAKTIPVIEDEPEFESAMPFENYFNVKKENERTNETISLIPPDDDEEEDEGSRFKGFFKKKK
ncbi:MAG TPA: hypothetical protein DD404_04135 [Ruminococcaceae bacterium]|nr:hypothetical protein [Oscillospiraceae bacterium]